jgi:hypothetical protein
VGAAYDGDNVTLVEGYIDDLLNDVVDLVDITLPNL